MHAISRQEAQLKFKRKTKMAFKQKKRKPLSREEQEYVKKKLEEYKNAFAKPLKGEIVFASPSSQEWSICARYIDEDALKKDAQSILEELDKINKGKWKLKSTTVLNRYAQDDEEAEKDDE